MGTMQENEKLNFPPMTSYHGLLSGLCTMTSFPLMDLQTGFSPGSDDAMLFMICA